MEVFLFGEARIKKKAGFKTSTLYAAPTAQNLKGSSVYIIVDPDTEKESSDPKFIQADHVKTISDWVKKGGILVMMGNDVGNAELEHFNNLAKVFGVQFNLDSKGKVTGDQFDMGKIMVPAGDPVFKTAKQLFIKEFSSLSITAPAKSILKDRDGNEVIALSKYGKGSVIIIGDPWLYNEYVDGKRLAAPYDNLKAGTDLIYWISSLIPAAKK
ncbi:lacto-N-biose phosphorylase central domain-containing protein [Pedobacter sp. NJ-S-72]